jgi:hypothetical protein
MDFVRSNKNMAILVMLSVLTMGGGIWHKSIELFRISFCGDKGWVIFYG